MADWIRRDEPEAGEVLRHLQWFDQPLDTIEAKGSEALVLRRHVDRIVSDLRYAGYLRRQDAEVKRMREAERSPIPESLDPGAIRGLRSEAVEVLRRFQPRTMGQASRLAGVNPADVTLIAVAIERERRRSTRAS